MRLISSLYVACFFLLMFTCANAQLHSDSLKPRQHAVYLEIGGAGGYGSLNFEQVIFRHKPHSLSWRAGFGFYYLKDYLGAFNPDVIIPLLVHYYIGKRHYLELGLGQVVTSIVQNNRETYRPQRNWDLVSTASVGYRYQPHPKGFLLRVTYQPLFDFKTDLRHWGGLSLGYAF